MIWRMLATGVLAAACGLLGAASTFSVPLPNHPAFRMNVVDRSGLVAGATAAPREGEFSLDGDVIADPGNNTLTLRWLGSQCRLGPSLTVAGTATELHLVLDPNAGPVLPTSANCPTESLAFALTLTLATTVAQDAVSLEVRR